MRRACLSLLALLLVGCAGRSGGRGGAPGPRALAGPAAPTEPSRGELAAGSPEHHAEPVPVSDGDPSWGSASAPVTLVVFSDFECPFCARAATTVESLKQRYGPDKVRLVWKNLPLPFHAHARAAAEAAMAVFKVGGNPAFWRFHDVAFAQQRALSPENLDAWVVGAGVDNARVAELVAAGIPKAKVDEDAALAARLGVTGTPVFRINGLPVVGAQPEESFVAIIDAQLVAAQALREAGVAPEAIYATLSARNLDIATASEAPADGATDDTTIWPVPVDGDDPVRGPDDAAVTVVLFSDLECPFCQRLEPTLSALLQRYGEDLRIVWKDFPLPFHRYAMPAAVLSRLAMGRHGQEGFWRAHDGIVAATPAVDEAVLKATASRVGVPWFEVQAAIADRRFQPLFDHTANLAKQLDVRGTPCVFINGRRIEGARPIEDFAAVIDAQLAKARDLLESGHPRAGLYAALTKTPEPEPEVERKTVAAPTRENPSRGNAKAPVTIQVFGDFQCPQTLRLMPKLAEVEKQFGDRVRVIWRNHPLAFHEDAALAAEAAQEVFVERGAAGFWRYHDLLFEAQVKGDLGRDKLVKLARKVGVDGRRFSAALDAHKHRPLIERDVDAARAAELAEVPAVLINGYAVTDVEPVEVFERLVRRALAEPVAH